jgi:hypothetical protein
MLPEVAPTVNYLRLCVRGWMTSAIAATLPSPVTMDSACSTGRRFSCVLDHYQSTMKEIRDAGNAAAKQFSSSHKSMTDRLLDRVSRRNS